MSETAETRYVSRLKEKYQKEVVPQLMQQFGYKSVMQVPRLVKIVINMGVGHGEQDPKQLDGAVRDLALISGQKPVVTRARKSISNFRIRKGHRIGAMVTLRGNRMYDFFDKLVNIVLPRVRDFQGVSPNSFDGRGNFSMGMREQLVFPEIVYDQVDRIRGMDICIVTTARTDEEARALLAALGMPFRQR